MKRKLKKFTGLVLALALVSSLLSVSALALGNDGAKMVPFDTYLQSNADSVGSRVIQGFRVSGTASKDNYRDVTVLQFPVGTTVGLKDINKYMLQVNAYYPDNSQVIETLYDVTLEAGLLYDIEILDVILGNVCHTFVEAVGAAQTPDNAGAPETPAAPDVNKSDGYQPTYDEDGQISLDDSRYSLPFRDVPNDAWFFPYVQEMYITNVMKGTSKDTFSPNQTLNRATTWVLLARISGKDDGSGDQWYSAAQKFVMDAGISDGKNPYDPISRQDFAVMAYKWSLYTGEPPLRLSDAIASGVVVPQTNLRVWDMKDQADVASYAREAVDWTLDTGILSGDLNRNFNPNGLSTRAHVSKVLTMLIGKHIWWIREHMDPEQLGLE